MFENIGRKDIFYVSVQIVLFGLYVFHFKMPELELADGLRYMGLICAGIGAVVSLLTIFNLGADLSPFPSPKEGSQLLTNGLFKWVRHPIYSGLLLAGYGWAIYTESVWKLVVTILLHILFYFKSVYEEKKLEQQFPDYSNYRKHTGRFFPKLKSSK